MSRRVRITLKGTDAQLGHIAASDFAQLLLLTQSALARTAGHVISRPVKQTGRWTAVIDEATKLRLVALEPGSVQAVLDLPDPVEAAGTLELADPRLGEVAFDALAAFVDGNDGGRSMVDVAAVLVQLGDRLGLGSRFDEIKLQDDERISGVVLDGPARERLRLVVDAGAEPGSGQIVGLLYEADFEQMRARLRLPGSRGYVTVDFDEGLADDIHAALRHQASLVGEVSVDPRGTRATSVRLREITVAEQLVAGADDFWRDTDVATLAREQGVTEASDWARFRDEAASEEDVDGILDFLST